MIPKIIVDKRELRSPVARELDKLGCDVEFVTAEVGDYILSVRCGCERKTADDFFDSLFGLEKNKLWGQLFDLKSAYQRPILIFEGYYEELFSTRNVNPKAIQGILNSLALMQIPMIFSLNPAGTAEILKSIATKEQSEDKRSFSAHGKRSAMNPKQKKEYVISSFPDCGVGTKTAIDLLTHFGSIEKVISASTEELQEVGGVGKVTAEKLRGLILDKY